METSLAVMKGLAVHADQRPASTEEFLGLLDGQEGDSGNTEVAASPGPFHPDGQVSTEPPDVPSRVDANTENDTTQELLTSSRVAFGVDLAALLGILFGPGEGSSTSFFAYLGTWTIVSLGLVGLFREAEKALTPESRRAVRDWLLQRDVAARRPNWPTTFTALFDAVFTDEHFSWTCFQRSSLISVAMIIILLAAVVGIGLVPADVIRGPVQTSDMAIPYKLLSFLAFAIGVNVVVDYLSLLETRTVLRWMSTTDRTSAHLGYIGLDLILTSLIFAALLVVMQPVLYLFYRPPAGPPLLTVEGGRYLLGSMKDALITLAHVTLNADRPPVVMVYSTLFTSVWIWLYAGTGLLLRLTYPFLQGLDELKKHFDVEARPAHSMGLHLAVVVSMVFAVLSPFML